MNDKIKQKKFEKERRHYLNKRFGKYGIVSEYDDHIEVKINQMTLYPIIYGKNWYIFSTREYKPWEYHFDGINEFCDSKSDIEKYNLIKPVCYIIEGIRFEDKTRIYANNANLLFNDCTFYSDLIIDGAKNVTMSIAHNCYYCINTAGNISINAEKINLNLPEGIPCSRGKRNIKLNANCIDLRNKSSYYVKLWGDNIDINTKELLLDDGRILGENIRISCDNIISDRGDIMGKTSVDIIERKGENNKYSVTSSNFIYNGRCIKSCNQFGLIKRLKKR